MGTSNWFKDWLDKNHSLFSININIPNLRSVKFLSDNKVNISKAQINQKDPSTLEFHINPQAHDSSDKSIEAIKELMRLSVPNAGGIIENKTNKLLEDVGNFQSDENSRLLLDKIKNAVPSKDFPIWEAALYIRKMYKSGTHIETLKQGLKSRFGDRGGNITNLCTAGYLEEIILPIYDELSKRPVFSIEEFNQQYEVIVTQYPFAVFVARSTPDNEVTKEIITKIQYNKTYGITTLNIHAIGDNNAKKVLSIIETNNVRQYFVAEPTTKRDGNVLQVVLYF